MLGESPSGREERRKGRRWEQDRDKPQPKGEGGGRGRGMSVRPPVFSFQAAELRTGECTYRESSASTSHFPHTPPLHGDSRRLLCYSEEAMRSMLLHVQKALLLRTRKRIWYNVVRDPTLPPDDSRGSTSNPSTTSSPRTSRRFHSHQRSRSQTIPSRSPSWVDGEGRCSGEGGSSRRSSSETL